MTNPDWLADAARRSETQPWALGRVLANYRRVEQCTEEALQAELGCSRETLQWLALCRCPEGKAFADDASRIAKRFAVDLSALIRVLRHVQVMNALGSRGGSGDASRRDASSLQMAARDRTQDDPDDP
ncbi:hypothetical protein DRW03_28590 [Corallococcus sp. H22C18031201]|uniref:hypothetical protein n=1 Tax=Citreicoccus inhibens TaxID=2849499 RepID=UPI000E7693F2|nr:hypothetical protein [Citreicoccus inhibens]MBU8897913.1 hypothetical protein [Citreicoccus inhibens]RJS17028.1 hypothetical protein DRW03_28590 [Corallococcus sp. H22C18031201]